MKNKMNIKRMIEIVACSSLFCLTAAGCQPSVVSQPKNVEKQPQAAKAEPQDKSSANSTGITQEEAGIKFRVDMPGIKTFLQKSKPGPVVPGLLQNAVPQGMAYLEDKKWIFISHYRDDGKPSFMTVTDAVSGKLIKTILLYKAANSPYTGHAGGITISKKHVWISSDNDVYMMNVEDIVKAEDGAKLAFAGSVRSGTRASFTAYSDGVLWIGEFAHGTDYPTDKLHYLKNRDGQEHKAWVEGYKLNPDTDLPAVPLNQGTPVPDYIISLPDSVQGMYMTKDLIWLSQSYGRNNASTLYRFKNPITDKPHTTVTIGSSTVPVWFLDSKNMQDKMELAPMSEGLFELDGSLYILFESGATKYRTSSSYALDHIQILQWRE